MRYLTFQAPPHHTFNVDGEIYHGGETFAVEDEERALELLTQPWLPVVEANPVTVALAALGTAAEEAMLDKLSRSELDDLARERGIDPERLPNKAAVIAALNEPEASGGEGQPTETEA